MRRLLKWLLGKLYKVQVHGLENYSKAGERVLIVANHLSFLDPLLLSLFLPERPMFAINTFVADQWYLRPFLKLVDCFAIDPTSPLATKAMINEIKQDKRCIIFPEGRITVTGSLMKIYEGPGMVADKSGAQILPIRIDGAQYTPFSRLRGKVKTRWFPTITLTILNPTRFTVAESIKGRKRRRVLGTKLHDLMSDMLFETSDYNKTLFQSLLDARHVHGSKHEVVIDIQRKPITYRQLIARSLILGRSISGSTKKSENVGLLLPNMVASIITFFALQVYERVPAMLNFSTGLHNILSACKTAHINNVITSKRFIEKAKLEEVIHAMTSEGITIHYLEEMADNISLVEKLSGLCKSFFAQYYYSRHCTNTPNDPAVILFTSGSEGLPKGVVLSHKNIQANRCQLAAIVDFGPTDIVFNALPIFHSFGLTGGALLPILSGIKTFLYPSPLHYRIVPELVYDNNATIMFGTDTFLSGYARFAHPYDFYSVRYVFAGAEKLKEDTRRIWSEKFGVRIFEGYGATETSPVISINTPMQNKAGTVGRLIPGMKHKLVNVPGIEEGGRLVVKGPNIMKGYLLSDNPGQLIPPENGWYDTGDIVTFDDEHYVTINGRAKRFAKIAGEMVSLTAVENYITNIWPDHHHAITAIPDKKKGEQLVLVTDYQDANRGDIIQHIKEYKLGELSIPKHIHIMDSVPLLGTGKTDYVQINDLVSNEFNV